MRGIIGRVVLLIALMAGTNVYAKSANISNTKLKSAVSKNLSFILGGRPFYACGMDMDGVINSIRVLKVGKYNRKYNYYPYFLEIDYSCKFGMMSVPGLSKKSRHKRKAKIKLYQDDFGDYKATRL